MLLRPPRSYPYDSLLPYTTLFRSARPGARPCQGYCLRAPRRQLRAAEGRPGAQRLGGRGGRRARTMSGTENWTESWSGASNRSDVESRLRRIGGQHDAEIDVAAAALLLAALQRPQQNLERCHHPLSLLARDPAA